MNAPAANDPVSQFIARATRGAFPVPLVSTSYDITIKGGLANVVAKRVFRNSETLSIEASITFPVPVHAVLFGLEAKIGGRVVKARARAKETARADYESAIDRGKTAVLHEELIKGVHMLSAGHIAPGTEIEVTAQFAVPLSCVDGNVFLRIPTTVGDIYGDSGLPDSDTLVHGGAPQAADLTVHCDSGMTALVGSTLIDGQARIALNVPIVIEVKGWTAADVTGRRADGSAVALRVKPQPWGAGVIDAAILIDHSGSMAEPCSSGKGASKHAAALLGLSETADDLRPGDKLHLFEFDDSTREIGHADHKSWRKAIRQLAGPEGGTEIGTALSFVAQHGKAADVLLITDGKSYALGVQTLAQILPRVSVVLIGDDSLEANVGHLAALTGGDIYVAGGTDVTSAIRTAIGGMRGIRDGKSAHQLRGGMIVEVLADASDGENDEAFGRAVGAYAASLAMLALGELSAGALAEAEGLVTHLTSLILVDEDGANQDGLPAMRKVALPTPATHIRMCPPQPVRMYMDDGSRHSAYAAARSFADFEDDASPPAARPVRPSSVNRCAAPAARYATPGASPSGHVRQNFSHGRSKSVVSVIKKWRHTPPDLSNLVGKIDWAAHGNALAAGDFSFLDSREGAELLRASEMSVVRRAARKAEISQVLLIIGLLARAEGSANRHASRVARVILANIDDRGAAQVAARIGLAPFEANPAA